MTREEEVNKFINKFLTDFHGLKHGKDREYLNDTYEASLIKEGVAWADKHPKSPWINVNDDLPCNHEELIYGNSTKTVLVIDHEGCVGLLKMKKKNNGIIGVEPWWKWEITSVIDYWMPIPELPKE